MEPPRLAIRTKHLEKLPVFRSYASSKCNARHVQQADRYNLALLSSFSTTLDDDKRTSLINCNLSEFSKRKSQTHSGQQQIHDLLTNLCLTSSTFVAFIFPLSDFLPRCCKWYLVQSTPFIADTLGTAS